MLLEDGALLGVRDVVLHRENSLSSHRLEDAVHQHQEIEKVCLGKRLARESKLQSVNYALP
jgi:hypothetical protein